jgi:DNA (cytosine-5)-methyltransferase 1
VSGAYYNEFDPFAAEWLRRLILFGHIAPGDVDERSIEDVNPDDLRGYTQCHFFAGIGVWSYALRRAGWPDDRPVWTGSCPCQPFSAAGKGGGVDDERHLWPHFHHLIRECRPGVVLGEQVASKDGLGWLDLVHADLEGENYAFAAVDLCAAGFGAPHIRQRLWWVGTNQRVENPELSAQPRQRLVGGAGLSVEETVRLAGRSVAGGLESDTGAGLLRPDETGACGLADTRHDERSRRDGSATDDDRRGGAGVEQGLELAPRGSAGGLADTHDAERGSGEPGRDDGHGQTTGRQQGDGVVADGGAAGGLDDGRRPGPTNGHWRDADWLFCRDGKWRPVEPGTFPLAHGASARVGRLRGYGNAIAAPVAQGFIEAVMDCIP